MRETEHLEIRSARALIFLVLRSRVAFMSKFSCLASLKSLFSPVTTDFRLFDCSTLKWSKSTRTPALHSVQMKVSEQHPSVEWRLGALAVMAAAGSENLRDPSAMAASPSTEMALSLSSVGMGVLVVMTATGAVAVFLLTEMALSLSSVGMGVMTATGAVAGFLLTEMALSLSSVGMGVLMVMTAAGSENPQDAAAMAASPPAGMALSLSSVRMGVSVVMAAAGSESPRDPAVRASSPPNDTCCRCRRRRWLFQQRWHQPMGPRHC